MKYYSKKPDICVRLFGEVVDPKHPIYKRGTLYFEHNRGLIVTQKHFNSDTKECFWSNVDDWIANDIYTCARFPEFFQMHATESEYPIFELRKIMWALRMKPLKKETWETYF